MDSIRESIKVLYFTLDFTTQDYRFITALSELEDAIIYFIRLENKSNSYETRQLPKKIIHIKWRGEFQKYKTIQFFNYLIDLQRIIRRIKPDYIHAGPIHSVAFKFALFRFNHLISMSW